MDACRFAQGEEILGKSIYASWTSLQVQNSLAMTGDAGARH
jgi:hypothetical protein